MQFADYAAAAASPETERDRLAAEGFLTAEEAAAIHCEDITAFFASPLAKRMEKAQKVLRELRFIGELTPEQLAPYTDLVKGQEPVVLNGIADCVLLEEGSAVVIDYKTDRVKTEDVLLERYRGQLELYAMLLSETLGCPVRECWIYSFALGRAVQVC